MYKRIGGFLYPFRWRLAGLAAVTTVVSILAMVPPVLIRTVVDRVIARGENPMLPRIAFLLFVVPLLHAAFGFIQSTGLGYVGQRFVMDLRRSLYGHVLGLSLSFFSRESTGKLVNRIMGDTANVQTLVTSQALQVLSDLVCAVFAIGTAFFLNWRLALLLLLILAFFAGNYRLNASRIRDRTRSYRGSEDRMSGDLQNRLVAHLTVKSFGAEDREHDRFRTQSDTALGMVEASQVAVTSFTMNTMLLRDLGRAVIYFTGCAMVLADAASYGDVVAFTAYAMQLLMPAVRFSELAQHMQDVGVSLDRVLDLFGARPEAVSRGTASLPGRVVGEVRFESVGFAYTEGESVIRDFSLHVAAGETVALVGPTGCGKSTVLSLLLRFFDPQSGRITIDGVDIRDLPLRILRRQFGIVLQEPLLFGVSIRDNIRYSSARSTHPQIEQAARVAEIHETIAALPRGYDSIIGGRHGTRLSVGEKQRISIARAVLADPAILIMDEATSALDSESERAIQHAMTRFLKNRTSFVVAHRLSTIRSADRIVVLDGGVIRECGPHDALMRQTDGRYRAMYLKHMGKGSLAEG